MLPRMVFLLTLMLLPSCAYLSNRARDAHHCLLVDGQAGGGISADAKVGPLDWCIGFGWGGYAIGKRTWWSGLGTFQEINAGVPVIQVVYPVNTHAIQKYRVPGFDTTGRAKTCYGRMATLGITLGVFSGSDGDKLTDAQIFADYFGIEAAAFAGVVGTRIGLNVAEFGDFMLGWFGLDILGDDIHPEETEQAPAEAPANAPEKTEERGTE